MSQFSGLHRGASVWAWMAAPLLAVAAHSPLAQADGVSPEAAKLLRSATDFLAKQQAFSIETRNSLEVVLRSGQKLQFDHTGKQLIQRPNKLRVERGGDLAHQVFYYDGKTLTLENPTDKVYATVAVPPTLDGMLDYARSQLDVVAPAGDLLYTNAYDILLSEVTTGFVVGKGYVEGVRCDHLAFSAPHVDTQIWIQEGKEPLVRKLVLTTKDVVNAPQFSVVATKWNLKPTVSDKAFTYKPAAQAKKVEFLAPAAAQ